MPLEETLHDLVAAVERELQAHTGISGWKVAVIPEAWSGGRIRWSIIVYHDALSVDGRNWVSASGQLSGLTTRVVTAAKLRVMEARKLAKERYERVCKPGIN